MLIPVKCFTCGKCIAGYSEQFEQVQKEILQNYDDVYSEYSEEDTKKITDFFESKNINRYCCRRMLSSHTNVFDDLVTSKDK